MRSVLVLSSLFPPAANSGAVRVGRLVRGLDALGWRVVVVAGDPAFNGRVDGSYARGLPDHLEVHREPIPSLRRGYARLRRLSRRFETTAGNSEASPVLTPSGRLGPRAFDLARRHVFVPDEDISWYPAAVRRSRMVLERRDVGVVLASAPGFVSTLVARSLHRSTGVPYVLDFRDEWIEHPWRSRGAATDRLEAAMERSVIASASRVTTISPEITAAVKRRYPLHRRKVSTLTNGFDEEEFAGLPRVGANAPRFMICHFGSIYRDLGVLFRALRRADERGGLSLSEVRIRLFGQVTPHVLEEALRHGVREVVEPVGYVTRDEALAAELAASVLLVLPAPGYGPTGKVFEYLGAGRPICALAAPDDTVSRILRQTGVGFATDSDVEGLASWLAATAAAARAGRDDRRIDFEALAGYSMSSVARRADELLTAAMDERP